MSWKSDSEGNVKCIFGDNCHVGNHITASLTGTDRSDMSFSDRSKEDDYTQRIDQFLPIMENFIGIVGISNITKKPNFWDFARNHWEYIEGGVGIHGHCIDYNRVWDETKPGETF